jgi:hypothetical protein
MLAGDAVFWRNIRAAKDRVQSQNSPCEWSGQNGTVANSSSSSTVFPHRSTNGLYTPLIALYVSHTPNQPASYQNLVP